MAATTKPGNPWNQFPKKKAPGKLSTRTAKPTVNPSRAVGAGGPPAAPPNRNGGSAGRGGALVKPSGNGANTSTRVNPVNVRDVTGQPRGQVSGATNKGSLSTAKPLANLPGGSRMSALPKGAASAAENVVNAASKAKGLGRYLGVAGGVAAIGATANSVFNPNSEGNQQLAKAAAAVNKRYSSNYGPRFKNPGSGASSAKGAKPKSPMPKGSGDALREKSYASLQKFQVPVDKVPAASKAPPVARSSSSTAGPTRSSGSTPMRPPVRSVSPPKSAAPQPGQSSDMNANYKAWAAANPKLAAKVKPGQAGYEAINGKPAPTKETAIPAKSDALKISADSGKNFRTDVALLDKKKKK